ncbi:MAG TPA: helix-turn-helix transcriptional regulator [Nitrososphaerales archaeon]|nr:helix-turn-helix transcriptional regulator [Nitrososphaerales archaeon]
MIRPVEIGETKLKIMRALAQEPSFGYDLRKNLSKERSITTASVYQHLSELDGTALVRRSGVATVKGRERVLYELTTKGNGFLRSAEKMKVGEKWGFVVD